MITSDYSAFLNRRLNGCIIDELIQTLTVVSGRLRLFGAPSGRMTPELLKRITVRVNGPTYYSPVLGALLPMKYLLYSLNAPLKIMTNARTAAKKV